MAGKQHKVNVKNKLIAIILAATLNEKITLVALTYKHLDSSQASFWFC